MLSNLDGIGVGVKAAQCVWVVDFVVLLLVYYTLVRVGLRFEGERELWVRCGLNRIKVLVSTFEVGVECLRMGVGFV